MGALADDAVRHYLNLPYRIALTRDGLDEDRPWRATVEELPGCDARGTTPTDAAAQIPAALAEWVASAQADGREVPEPRFGRNHSGKLLLRMPTSLHGDLADAAEREQVSLNAYINMLLVAAVQSQRQEWPRPQAPEPEPYAERAGDDVVVIEDPAQAVKLQRFLAIALTANVAVVAIAAAIAVILLLSAL